MNLRDRLLSHSEKLKQAEELKAALAGVFDQEAQAKREKFEALVRDLVKPAFDDFKLTLREIGKDATIILRLTHGLKQSITLVLHERYLSFGAGKTIKLVNPKEDVTERPSTKFYEVYRHDDLIYVRQRWNSTIEPVVTQLGYDDVVTPFLENELAAFFERAYPMVTSV
jgi:hypothetical protein